MESLQDLARKEFPDLSEAEERVVRHAPDGTKADCTDLGGSRDPKKANGMPEVSDERWPDTRNVRAELIRWLCIDREAREQVDVKGVWIEGARITSRLDLRFANILVPLVLSGCRLEQDLYVQWAKMPVLCLDDSWTKAIGADGLKLEGDISLASGFHAEGEVRLAGAIIGGNLIAEGGIFKNPSGAAMRADRIEVTGTVFLTNFFSAEGEVRLLGATIGGNLDATGGAFKNSDGNALNAAGVKVHGSVFLRRKFAAEGQVRLIGAEVDGQLEVIDAWLDVLNLESAYVTGSLFWRNIHKDHHPDLPNKEWKPYLNLADAKVGVLVDQEVSWPEKGRLFLDGFVYDRVADGPTDAKTRLKWLHLQRDELGYLPQPYEQLIAVLRRMGHEHQVAEIAIAKQKDLYEHGDLGRWRKFWSWVLFHSVRYGYEPWRAFMWMAILVIVGTLVFSVARLRSVSVMVPSDKEAYQSNETVKMPLPDYYPQFHAFVYSIDVILPFDLGQKTHWELHERRPWDFVYWLFESYSLFQLFVGWVLLIVAAAVPAGLIKRD